MAKKNVAHLFLGNIPREDALIAATRANKVDTLPQMPWGVKDKRWFPTSHAGVGGHALHYLHVRYLKSFTVMSPFMFQKIHSMIVTTYQPTQTKKNSYPYYVPLCKQKTAISTYTFEKLRWKLKILPLEKEKQWETSRNHQFWEFQPLVFGGVTH